MLNRRFVSSRCASLSSSTVAIRPRRLAPTGRQLGAWLVSLGIASVLAACAVAPSPEPDDERTDESGLGTIASVPPAPSVQAGQSGSGAAATGSAAVPAVANASIPLGGTCLAEAQCRKYAAITIGCFDDDQGVSRCQEKMVSGECREDAQCVSGYCKYYGRRPGPNPEYRRCAHRGARGAGCDVNADCVSDRCNGRSCE